jgi:soluble lytic murein transglycosylase-like protein
MATPPHESRWFRSDLESLAAFHKIDPNLVEAVVRIESAGLAHAYRYEPAFFTRYLADDEKYSHANPRRVSASYGLMQIMYPVAVEHGFNGPPEELFIPREGLDWGCTHLASLLKWSKGNVDAALAAYNGGKGGNAKPPYRNQTYVSKVLVAFSTIKEGH